MRYRRSVIPYMRVRVRFVNGLRIRQNESLHVAIGASCEYRIGRGTPNLTSWIGLEWHRMCFSKLGNHDKAIIPLKNVAETGYLFKIRGWVGGGGSLTKYNLRLKLIRMWG